MNHYPPRVMGGPQAGPAQRLNELLDNIKTEFEAESQRSVDAEGQSESFLCSSAAHQGSLKAASKDASKLSAHATIAVCCIGLTVADYFRSHPSHSGDRVDPRQGLFA
jgi:hypothetical protein